MQKCWIKELKNTAPNMGNQLPYRTTDILPESMMDIHSLLNEGELAASSVALDTGESQVRKLAGVIHIYLGYILLVIKVH